MCKLKASEAFKHVKALWPKTEKIEPAGRGWSSRDSEGCVVAGGGWSVEIDWEGEDCYPVPVKVTYREPTLEDIKNGTEAEFCDTPAFQNNFVAKRRLAGITLVRGNVARGWICDNGSVFTHCRVPVTVPTGWKEYSDSDRLTYGGHAVAPNCDLMSISGEIARSCYWHSSQKWKIYGSDSFVTFTPAYIRKAQ